MKKLFLFTRNFPYGTAESYLETEVKYYSSFDEVHIFSLSVEKEMKRREVYEDKDIHYHTIYYQHIFKYIFALFFSLFSKDLYTEIYKLIKNNQLSIGALSKVAIYLSKSKIETKEIKQLISKEDLVSQEDEIILYSYRFDYAAYLIAHMKLNSKRVVRTCRAHGIDLYEFRHTSNYLPYREKILKKIDRLILISKQNYNYAKLQYPDYSDKFIISYMGTNDLTYREDNLQKPLKIVSVSDVVPVKRVDMIFESLKLASNLIDIDWVHYGASDGFNKLENKVKNYSGEVSFNVTLKGHVDNKEVLKDFEQKRFHLFVNLSTTEGLPVSIMEAMSVGIPVIATDVGGTSEIVINQYNGVLLNENPRIEEVAEEIIKISKLKQSQYLNLRENARNHWEEKFNAKKNYKEFSTDLLKFFKEV